MQRIFLILISVLLSTHQIFAISRSDIGFQGALPDGSILQSNGVTIIALLTLAQSILLKLVLPIVIV